jgi:hypothetical protein
VPTIYLHIIKELIDGFDRISGKFNPLSNPLSDLCRQASRLFALAKTKAPESDRGRILAFVFAEPEE